MKIAGGIHGDVATASIVVNSIPKVLQRAARPAHDARPAAAVVLPRPIDAAQLVAASLPPQATPSGTASRAERNHSACVARLSASGR